ncbi:hypothetical protein F5Y01DRAFT_84856 [Xylaria sp. FL0043]|nr:hypothetical protein F5Y01DRAFT_84856 [Xylaria sp. FL0043]
MPTNDALTAKVEELERLTAIIAGKCNGTVPAKSSLEVAARQLLSISEAHDPETRGLVIFPSNYGYVDWWSPWGYQVHLTNKAISDLNSLTGVAESSVVVASIVVALIGSSLVTTAGVATLLASVLAARAKIMYWVADGGDLDLYSPWVAIVAFIPVRASPWSNEDRMGFSVFINDSWSSGMPFIGGSATSGGLVKQSVADAVPSFASYNGRLYAVFNSSDEIVYYCAYDAKAEDDGWRGGFSHSIQTAIYGLSPTMVEYNGRLYIAQRHSSTQEIWWSWYDRMGWASEQALNGGGAYTSDRVGLAKFNDKIYLVARGVGDNDLWWSTFDGDDWSSYTQVGAESSYGPALATFEDELHMVARGVGDDSRLWHYRYDGQNWDSGALDGVYSNGSPALAVFDSKLYCAAVGNEGAIWYMSYSDGQWSTYTETQLNSQSGPSLCVYTDNLSDQQEMLLCYDPRTT